MDNLSQQLIAGLDIDIIPKHLSLHTNYRYLDRVSLTDYQLLDMKLNFKSSNFNAYINANNVLDTKYRETNLVPMPGRWFGIGFQFF